MSFITPKFRHPELGTNSIGCQKRDYEGSMSTLCAGCGHDAITAALITACFELSIEPHRIAKISGIGCSSKTPAYFLGKSHSFNAVHGRMPSVATGSNAANRDMIHIGVSGDGDTASIGMGQFVHAMRRNLNMVYIVENNGCYGLTKGQASATADIGSVAKNGTENPYTPIDLVSTAIEMGASFVARSFSGDKTQLIPLLKSAIKHQGFAFIDIISPCVTFNNTDKSTKSYSFVREHMQVTGKHDFVPLSDNIEAEYDEGQSTTIIDHNDAEIELYKLDTDYNPYSKELAQQTINEVKSKNKILTGLIYAEDNAAEMHDIMGTSDTPLFSLTKDDLCPDCDILDNINKSLR